MIRPLILAALVVGTAAAADQPARPLARPEAEASLRPLARPADPPTVATASDPLANSAAEAVSDGSARRAPAPRQLLRAEAAMRPPAVDLRSNWQGAAAPLRPAHLAVAAIQPMRQAPARPPLRPHMPWMDVVQDPAAVAEATADPGFTPSAVALALRPPERPSAVAESARRLKAERARGQICSTPELQGEAIGTVPGPGDCGIDSAVRVRSVAGVVLSTPATMDCSTARSLLAWVQTGAIPVVGSKGGGLRGLRVVAHYACRGRNNVPGARLSEHSFGRAIDIAAFQLRDGSEISVLRDWSGGQGDILRRMWRAACGPFGTVLGPAANAAHRDHFHFDTARYRAGSYCR